MAALHCWDQLKAENSSENIFGSLQEELLKHCFLRASFIQKRSQHWTWNCVWAMVTECCV